MRWDTRIKVMAVEELFPRVKAHTHTHTKRKKPAVIYYIAKRKYLRLIQRNTRVLKFQCGLYLGEEQMKHVCMYVCMYYVCMYVRMYVCMYVLCMRVCMYERSKPSRRHTYLFTHQGCSLLASAWLSYTTYRTKNLIPQLKLSRHVAHL